MKEIKYRGKEYNSNEWVYGDLLHITNGMAIFRNAKDTCKVGKPGVVFIRGELSIVRPDTVGMYLPVINAYEGDLLKHPSMAHLLEAFVDDYSIKLKDVSNGLVYGVDLFDGHKDTFIIVGNIYDKV